MLAALGALAVPVVLHLIARQRFPVQPIPNIRLLQAEQRTNAYAVRPVDLWQLVLRLLVVAAVVLAISRPVVWSGFGRTARNAVVVLDCSPSMLISANGKDSAKTPDGAQATVSTAGKDSAKIFDRARTTAVELLKSAGPHDEVAYIEAGSAAKIVTGLSGNAADAARLAQNARVQFRGGSSVGPAIAKACEMLAARREALSEIYVLSDLRRNVLDGWDDRARATLAATKEKLGDRLKLRLVDFAPDKVQNLGIV